MHRRTVLKGLGGTMLATQALMGNAHAAPAKSTFKDIYRHIDDHYDAHLSRIQEFIRQRSISSQNVGVRECAELLAGYMRQLGATAELAETDGFPVVFGKYDAGADKTLLIYSLYDVVYVNESEWSSPPFAANVVDMPPFGRALIGRGATNQKGPIGALLNAMQSIIAVRRKLPVNVLFAIEGEEELASPHLHQFFERYHEQLQQADAVLGPGFSQDGAGVPSVTLGNKGIVYMELSVDGKDMPRGPQQFDLSSYQQNIVEGPVWYLIEALNTLTADRGTKLAVDELNAQVVMSPDDIRIVEELAKRIDARKGWGERMKVEEFADGLTGKELIQRHYLTPSLCIDGIWSGYTDPGQVQTLLPQKATAKLDLRLVPNQRAESVVPALRRHLDARGFQAVKIKQLAGYNLSRTKLEAPVVQSLMRSYRRYGMNPIVSPLSAAGNPSHLMTEPPLSLDKIGGGIGHGGRQHSVDEYFIVEGRGGIAGLPDIEKFYVDFLYDYAKA